MPTWPTKAPRGRPAARHRLRAAWLATLSLAGALFSSPGAEPAAPPLAPQTAPEAPEADIRARLRFEPDGLGGFVFNTGVLRGRLHAGGTSVGLTEVFHVPSHARLDQSQGLLSHYRVFANGQRFGVGAWDWPSVAAARDDGAVEVRWLDDPQRPFGLEALYRLPRPGIVSVETRVRARAELRGFEVFLASYFDPAFSNAFVHAKGRVRDGFLNATLDRGPWQMYPRDAAARALAEDGRWRLEPHPVDWTFPAELAGPPFRVYRRALSRGILAMFNAEPEECFAVAMPHQTEPHFSTYLSLFGRTLAPGQEARATVRLLVTGPAAPAAP